MVLVIWLWTLASLLLKLTGYLDVVPWLAVWLPATILLGIQTLVVIGVIVTGTKKSRWR